MSLAIVFHRYLPSEGAKAVCDEQIDAFFDSPMVNTPVYLTSDPDGTRFEYPGIAQVWELAQNRAVDVVGYWHTKGVTHLENEAVQDWRRYMQAFFLRGPSAKVLSGEADVCGVNYQTNPWPHFSGNFWWARADYLRQHAKPRWSADRMTWEKWLCSIPGHRADCLHQSGVNHYHQRYSVGSTG